MKRVFPIILLSIYMALLTLPYYPNIHYYIYNSLQKQKNETSFFNADTKVIIGDISYLSAIMKRAQKNNDTPEKHDAPPPPAVETSGIVYLCVEALFSFNIILPEKINFKKYMISIKETFLEIPVPPPRFLS